MRAQHIEPINYLDNKSWEFLRLEMFLENTEMEIKFDACTDDRDFWFAHVQKIDVPTKKRIWKA